MQRPILTLTGIVFLSIQVILFIGSFTRSGKHFSWAPHNSQVKYTLECTINDSALDSRGIFNRYGLYSKGWEAHHEENIKAIILARERQSPETKKLSITYTYSVNGGPGQIWTYAK